MDEEDAGKSPSERQRAVQKLHSFLQLMELVPDGIITVGLSISLYVRYEYYNYTSLVAVGGSALLIVVINSVLRVYWNKSAPVCTSMYHLWIGCILGLVTLLDISSNMDHKLADWEDLANLILVASVVCRALVQVLLRCCKTLTLTRVWTYSELFELVGAACACVLAAPPDQLRPLLALLCALTVLLTTVRLGSIIAVFVLSLVIFTCEHYLFPDMHLSSNPFALIVFIARLAVPPIIDHVCGGFGHLDQWTTLIMAKPCYHHFLFLNIITVESVFFVTHSIYIRNHTEWYVVVPLFSFLAVLWIIMHVIFAIVIATLTKKFFSSRISLFEDVTHLKKALGARGLKHFSLVAEQLIWICVMTTVLIGLMCWTTRSVYTFSLWIIAINIELMLIELLAVLGRTLGGTCIAYSLILPMIPSNNGGSLTLLPANFLQDAAAQSNKVLRSINYFFSERMITNYGCEWSTGGISSDDLENKMRAFFGQMTQEGTRYDTYCYYYSGPTNFTGEWALKDGMTMSLDRITCKWYPSADDHHPTHFTLSWIGLNEDQQQQQQQQQEKGGCQCRYALSRNWVDFDHRRPSAEVIVDYWLPVLPSFTQTSVRCAASLSVRTPFVALFQFSAKLIRRARIFLCLPSRLDTGHGFTLINT